MALSDCQFFAYAIIRLSGFHIFGIALYTVVWSMMERVILCVAHSGKDDLVYNAWLFMWQYYMNLVIF